MRPVYKPVSVVDYLPLDYLERGHFSLNNVINLKYVAFYSFIVLTTIKIGSDFTAFDVNFRGPSLKWCSMWSTYPILSHSQKLKTYRIDICNGADMPE